ncbi:hypothetical protein [Bradyrhizobium sp. WSM1417]|uniref:hypothetical protein n=1 Tax=Bradyrhizobium sp. WSM1417 TaxID=754500 RepID=UPI00048204D2|nr:hypothetical protein [Bradyrhizobium sp. WSM1417]
MTTTYLRVAGLDVEVDVLVSVLVLVLVSVVGSAMLADTITKLSIRTIKALINIEGLQILR